MKEDNYRMFFEELTRFHLMKSSQWKKTIGDEQRAKFQKPVKTIFLAFQLLMGL
jgi:hypothetical protein